jgi:hypothetical protein
MKRVIVFVLVAALVNTACAYAAKDKVERSFKLEYFDELDVTSAIKVSLTQGKENSIVIRAEEDVIDYVTFRINRDNELEIFIDQTFFDKVRRGFKGVGEVEVDLTFTTLKEINASAASYVESTETLQLNRLSIEATSASKVVLDLNAGEVDAEATSAATIILKGKADSFDAEASSAAQIKASDFIVSRAELEASSAGKIKVRVNGVAEAEASSAGNIRIYGDAQLRRVEANSGGSVKLDK